MQKRQAGEDLHRWFDEGDVKLPAGKANFDENLLLTPPSGLGVWLRTHSCLSSAAGPSARMYKKVGVHKSEPEPLPSGYYEGFDGEKIF